MADKAKLLAKVAQSITDYCNEFYDYSFNPDKPIVRLHEPTFGADEIYAATEQMLSTYVTMGKKVKEFERAYADLFGHRYGVMSNSGSSANLLAFAALTNPLTSDRLMPGDEVIVPALSWPTTIWPIIQCNLVPVVVDCELNSFNFDLNKLEAAISPKTRAIMLVHVYGNPCNMDGLMAIAKKHNLTVVEDACESMGAYYDGKAVGSFGRIGNLSFYYSHHITTLEGGINVTEDFETAETLRVLRAHGWHRETDEKDKYAEKYSSIDPRFIFINLGYNLRPTEVDAVFGLQQLPKLDKFINLRRETAAFFLKELAKYGDYFQFQQETPKGKHTWFGFSIILKENAPFSMKEITDYMQKHHIETRPIIAGNMARHPGLALYQHRIAGDLNVATTVMQRGFAIGCHHAIDAKARQYVVDVIDSFMQSHGKKSGARAQASALHG